MKAVKLKGVFTEVIEPVAPFHFDGTFHKPDHFTTNDHIWEPGIRWQTINWDGFPLGIKFANIGTVAEPKVEITLFAENDLNTKQTKEIITELSYRFNFNLDLADFYKKFSTNPFLKESINNLYGMRPGHPSSLYEYLIIGIILQNASIRRSTQMFENLLQRYGKLLSFDGKELLCLWGIGEMEKVSEDELRALKVGYRAKSILRLDEQFRKGLINEVTMRKLDVVEQKKQLLALYGVGPATVWYLLFDVFHRWEVFEHISPWEQKLYSQMFFNRGLDDLATVPQLLTFINKFGKYKQLAVHYLWEDLWWKRENGQIFDWLEKEIRR